MSSTTHNEARRTLEARLLAADGLLGAVVFSPLGDLAARRRHVLFGADSPTVADLRAPITVTAMLSHQARRQQTLGPVGSRSFINPGLLILHAALLVDLPASYRVALAVADGLGTTAQVQAPGFFLPSATYAADALYRDFLAAFDGRRFGGVIVGAASFREAGVDAGWYRAVIEQPFEFSNDG